MKMWAFRGSHSEQNNNQTLGLPKGRKQNVEYFKNQIVGVLADVPAYQSASSNVQIVQKSIKMWVLGDRIQNKTAIKH